jgi:CBS domain-containing protein
MSSDRTLQKEAHVKVRDLMTTTVASVNRDEPLSAAAELMWRHDCGAVPVRDGDVVIGMLTDRDITR